MRYRYRVPAAAVCALLAACAAGGPQKKTAQEQALERYSAYAGPPVSSFWWPGHFYSWEPLGKDHLALFTTPFDAYLLKVWPPCDMRFVLNTIGLTSTSNYVYAHTDSVTMNSSGTGPGMWRCPIDEIRKIDYQRMRADLKAGRAPAADAASAPPAQPAAATPPAQPPPQ